MGLLSSQFSIPPSDYLCQGAASYQWNAVFAWVLGISYLTFRSVGIIIELRDGVIKDFTLWEFLRFLLFMPTFQVAQSIVLSDLMKIIRPFLSEMS